MSVSITINGSAEEVIAELYKLLATPGTSAPAVSGESSDSEPRQGRIMQPTVDTGGAVAITTADVVPAKRGRKPKAEIAAQPLTAEFNEAVDKTIEADKAADQDKADEKADSDATAPAAEEKVFTLDDVREAASPYIKKWTIANAQIDLQDVLDAAVGVRQIKALDPANQDQLKKAIAAFDVAGEAEARFEKKAA